jgi:cobalt-zinc-cadmium efflux system outer membrane protein
MYQRLFIGFALVASLLTSTANARAAEPGTFDLTYERALELARQQSPELVAARARVREAEIQVDAAGVWRFNPRISTAVGPRRGPDGNSVDWSVGVMQQVELGGQRGDRVDVAEAGVTAGLARSEDEQRRLLRGVSLAFIAALYWEERVAVAEENLGIAQGIARVARRRHEAGDVGGLEESVSALAVLRAQSQLDQGRASLEEAEGQLKALLGLDSATELSCTGELLGLGIPEVGLSELSERPDLRALQADIVQAEAQAELGRAERAPGLRFGAVYSREESANIVQGTLALTLPVFSRGQGTRAIAQAREERLRLELKASESSAMVRADSAATRAEQLEAAALRFEREGLEALSRAEGLATANYEAGAIPLGELLALRRELVQTKLDHVDLLLRAAVARAELAASTGALK